MHEQIRTSPGSTGDNLSQVVEILAAADINIEGVGPDFESPHVRVAVNHEDVTRALTELRSAFPEADTFEAVTIAMPNVPHALHKAMRALQERGFCIQSILVLAGHAEGDLARVSFGVMRCREDGWERTADAVAVEIAAEIAAKIAASA